LDLRREFAERLQALGLSMSEHCLLVSVDQQKLWHFCGSGCDSYTISTARAGRGCVQDSQQTPTGLHQVSEKIGEGAPLGMVFKARQPTGTLWGAWPTAEDNLITTRILWLDGLEPGHNRGTDASGRVVDTKRRFVYIHGTNQHARLGTPNSHGCVLLSDGDVQRLFDRVPVGTQVYVR
jgi:lipoprotein-anchoring transpeptidase ErfK/SrfK